MLPVEKIQQWMKANSIDFFLINRTDEFLSEYIAPYAERLNWISNFSGSAGRCIIKQDQAFIFIDGRYTAQAHEQVDSNYFQIQHLKNYWSYLKNIINEKKILTLDPKLHSIDEVEKVKNIFADTKISLRFLDKNPINIHWENQPVYPNSSAFIHEDKYAGESATNKLKKIQNTLQSTFIDYYLLSSLDSIAWLLNIRGDDIDYTPLLCCFIIIPHQGKIELFVDDIKIISIKKKLEHFVNFHSFSNVDKYLTNVDSRKIIGMDKKKTTFHFKNICSKENLVINFLEDPCLYPKAIKNQIELDGARNANLRDGISISKFLYWLKNDIDIENTDEIKAADYLLNLRNANDLFYSPSFDTISAFGHHAALPHYRVDKESNLSFKNNSIYLVDSGAQYKDGTTDITRTVIIGEATDEHKDRFTRVLKGHIAIAQAQFDFDTNGSKLDTLARKSLQDIDCDYDHGTGHGIGSFLSVHEGPQRIAKAQEQSDGIIYSGMILSNEPGFYKVGEYGIRIENLMICLSKNEQSLYFETISWAPIDRDLINLSLLDDNEKKWMNDYHKKVYEKISPYLNKNEREWLYLATETL